MGERRAGVGRMLEGKTALLGVAGGIAAYKMPNLARMLKKLRCRVHVIMTENARNFVTETTFETLTGNKCLVDTFDRNFEFSVEHVALAKEADLALVAPATADVIGKIANGIADDMLTTTIMACTCKTLIAPAMNHNMYHNPIVQENLRKLERFGYRIIPPDTGMLANGDIGDGRLPDEERLLEYVLLEIAREKDLAGKKVLVTAGATQEAIDPVRYITNHSTGKMGYALARDAARRGADVTMVTGATALRIPAGVEAVPVVSSKDMARETLGRAAQMDIIVKAAAVADFRPVKAAEGKIKKADGLDCIPLERTEDILGTLGRRKQEGEIHAFLCGFSMETEDLLENSRKKLEKKHVDMIAANHLREEGAGFGTDTNVLTLLTKDGAKRLGRMSKEEAAGEVFDEIIRQMGA